jgi:PAS domain S-box-containing protein
VENIPLAISIINKDNICIYANSIANRIFGGADEIVEGKTIEEILGPEAVDQVKSEVEKVFHGKKRLETERPLKIKGKFHFFRTLRLPLFDEKKEVSSVLIIAEDITELKRQEFLLKIQHKIDSLSNLTASLNASIRSAFRYLMQIDWVDGGGIYLFDEDEKHLRLAYSEGLYESFIQQVSVYRREEPPVQLILMKKPKYAKISDFNIFHREALLKEGLVMAVSIPLAYQDKVIGSLNLGSKTTDEINHGDKLVIESIANRLANLIVLVQTREKLVRTNYELNVSLKEIREKQDLLIQKSKLESLGELAAGLAHEINQPLSVISLAFENISYRLIESPVNQEYFTRKSETISQNIEKIRQLIDHIRIFSRDQSSVMFEKTDINLAINETLNLMEPQMARMHIKMEVDLCKGKCVTLGNLTKLEQVILNLISNARDAVEEKAMMTRNAGYSGRIYIETAIENRKVIVKVEDNGIGIKLENQQKIFTPFFTTKPPGQGTGLGLAIVYGIITEMKGTIEVFSEYEKFTNILLTFPKI